MVVHRPHLHPLWVRTIAPAPLVQAAVMMRCPNTACDTLRLTYLSCIYLGGE